ncbi:MAG: SPOR domain-containing protein, partial [Ruthenibacterium sp.]
HFGARVFIAMGKHMECNRQLYPRQNPLYKVQVGAFSQKANADAMLQKLKAAGFTDAFIKYSE